MIIWECSAGLEYMPVGDADDDEATYCYSPKSLDYAVVWPRLVGRAVCMALTKACPVDPIMSI